MISLGNFSGIQENALKTRMCPSPRASNKMTPQLHLTLTYSIRSSFQVIPRTALGKVTNTLPGTNPVIPFACVMSDEPAAIMASDNFSRPPQCCSHGLGFPSTSLPSLFILLLVYSLLFNRDRWKISCLGRSPHLFGLHTLSVAASGPMTFNNVDKCILFIFHTEDACSNQFCSISSGISNRHLEFIMSEAGHWMATTQKIFSSLLHLGKRLHHRPCSCLHLSFHNCY